MSHIESVSYSSYLARICFTLVMKLLPSLSQNRDCLFATRTSLEFPDLRQEYNKLKCLLSSSASKCKAPNSRRTAAVEVLSGRSCNFRKISKWKSVKTLMCFFNMNIVSRPKSSLDRTYH